jgi:hypothetical protein
MSKNSTKQHITQVKAWMKTLKSHVQKPKDKRRPNLRRMEK